MAFRGAQACCFCCFFFFKPVDISVPGLCWAADAKLAGGGGSPSRHDSSSPAGGLAESHFFRCPITLHSYFWTWFLKSLWCFSTVFFFILVTVHERSKTEVSIQWYLLNVDNTDSIFSTCRMYRCSICLYDEAIVLKQKTVCLIYQSFYGSVNQLYNSKMKARRPENFGYYSLGYLWPF